MRFSTSKYLHINDHLKAHSGYKSCPRTLGTDDLMYGGTRTHDVVVESPVPYPLGHPPLPKEGSLILLSHISVYMSVADIIVSVCVNAEHIHRTRLIIISNYAIHHVIHIIIHYRNQNNNGKKKFAARLVYTYNTQCKVL